MTVQMQAITHLKDRTVGVLGLARSGVAVAKSLLAAGVDVVLYDDKTELVQSLAIDGMRAGTANSASDLDLLIVSPGVPLSYPAPHPLVADAKRLGVEITSDIELFARALKAAGHKLVGVTGTNGKSTVTALIHHLLKTAGKSAVMGGNIGLPVFDLTIPNEPSIIVLELSSYQLELAESLHPDIGVWLNLTPDHLDRYADIDGYIRAKRRLFANMTFDDRAVIGLGDTPSQSTADLVSTFCSVWLFGCDEAVDCQMQGETLYCDGQEFLSLRGLPALRGAHNGLNVAAAAMVLRAFEVESSTIQHGLMTFAGLPHRAQEVARIGHVHFINDSKATNPVSAAKSLSSFDRIHWIAGGRPKPGGFGELIPYLDEVVQAYLIGEAAPELETTLTGIKPFEHFASMAEATSAAYASASREDAETSTILLAPACASFDQFKSYEERGDRFKQIALSLADKAQNLQASSGSAP